MENPVIISGLVTQSAVQSLYPQAAERKAAFNNLLVPATQDCCIKKRGVEDFLFFLLKVSILFHVFNWINVFPSRGFLCSSFSHFRDLSLESNENVSKPGLCGREVTLVLS